ncbi:aminoacyl-tRNA hydrolase [Aeromicrobium sp. IC_218]|nr:aminoacyl-tRNA hydrolase [Aeromicrobium sp. IC_218]
MNPAPDRRHRVPDSELTWRFSRSSGPGGQHVNTTDTKAELLWDVRASEVLDDAQKAHVLAALSTRATDGVVRVVSSRYASQHRNREAAKARLEELVAAALVPRRKRRATKPTRGSQERRLAAKKLRSDVKSGRQRRWD